MRQLSVTPPQTGILGTALVSKRQGVGIDWIPACGMVNYSAPLAKSAPPSPRQINRSVPALATVLAFGIADCWLKAALKLPVRRHFLAAGP